MSKPIGNHQIRVMQILADAGKQLSVYEIGEELGMPGAGAICSTLVTRGCLRRVRRQRFGKLVECYLLTAAGKAFLEQVKA